ncbi:MAG: hypothetical protein IKO36_12215 [Bacteroidaceae bacterium]|nr:hypothetical protein [Bacteroidaceae bacterium]
MKYIKNYNNFTLQDAVHECIKQWAVEGYDNELQRLSDFEDMAYGGGNIDSLSEDVIEFLVANTDFDINFLKENKDEIVKYMSEQAKIEMPFIINFNE